MENMTIVEAMGKLKVVRDKVKTLLADYENETGLFVKAVEVAHNHNYDSLTLSLTNVTINVMVIPWPKKVTE